MKSHINHTDIVAIGRERMLLGECPRWDEQTQTLWWVDIGRARLYHRQAGSEPAFLQLDEATACLALDQKGGLVLAGQSGFSRLPDPTQPVREPIVDPEADKPWQRFNDGRCDSAGRFIAGTMNPDKDEHFGTFYQLAADGTVRPLVGRSWTCNGLAFSPDGCTLYWADTPNRSIYCCEYDLAEGRVVNQRLFYVVPEGWGRPDGACVDSEGCYWSAQYGGGRLLRLSPEGELLETVPLPVSNPTMPAFGGPDLKTLYVTSASQGMSEAQLAANPLEGAVLALPTAVAGLTEARFAG